MSAVQFLAEWAIRSSVLVLGGALLLWALRVKDASVRLAGWTAILGGSVMIPVIAWTVPELPVTVSRVVVKHAETPAVPAFEATVRGATLEMGTSAKSFDWARAALIIYAAVAGTLLLRLAIGLAISLRMLRASRPAGRMTHEIDVRESDAVTSPLVLGILRPRIVLPADWREWNEPKLAAVLAHERSHIARRDPAVQLLGAIHRALLWHSPLSWFLLTRIVRSAEEASDDAALRASGDRALYARLLLEFIARGGPKVRWLGVSMARYGSIDRRIQRILDGPALTRSLTRWTRAAIVVFTLPMAYVIAAARPQTAIQTIPSAPPKGGVAGGVVDGVPGQLIEGGVIQGVLGRQPTAPSSQPLQGLGSVVATTVTVRPRIEGQLLSVTFKEGAEVHEGDVLATIDAKAYQLPLEQAKADLLRDEADLERLPGNALQQDPMARKVRESAIKVDEARLQQAELQLSYANVTAPISGVTGLRLVDPGNFVRLSDGIVVITQLQPIAVVFTLSEDLVPRAMALLQSGSAPVVEAWNREMTKKIAMGRLVAIDNQIDPEAGVVKLKATFDNKDRALYPSQFVNVVMRISDR